MDLITDVKTAYTWLGIAVAFIFYYGLSAHGLPKEQALAACIAGITVIWWITEALPVPVTSLVPIVAFPLFGIVDYKEIALSLGNHVILLLMGAFMLSKAMEKSGVAKRLAVYLLRLVGVDSGKRLVFGFMLTSSLLSMWISNTATTLMMLPIAMAVMKDLSSTNPANKQLRQALILGIAYAANVGGVGTLVGTPPNIIFAGIYQELTGSDFSFALWLSVGFPVILLAIPIMSLWLTRRVGKTEPVELPKLSVWRVEERRTLLIIALTAFAWVTRKEPLGGWSQLFGLPLVGDSTVVLIAIIILFALPNGKGGRLLDWEHAKAIPWGTLLLFAGGIALAKGMNAAGLVAHLAEGLQGLTVLPVYVMMLSLCLIVTFLTEVTSNTATTTLLMPVLAACAMATGVSPELLMVPAALSASCAFMLPVATAPNAIVFGTGEFRVTDMLREGIVLSLLLALIIASVSYVRLL